MDRKALEVVRTARASGQERWVDLATGPRTRVFHWTARRGARDATRPPRTVLMVHPHGYTALSWAWCAKTLTEEGYDVVAYDLRGHGGTSMASGTPVSATVDDLVRDAHALVVELDLYKRPLGLVGVGLGAVIALLFAARHPDIVAALWTSGLPQLRLGPSAAANPIAYNLSFLPDAKHARLVPGPAAIEETVSAIAAANSFAAEPPPGPEGRARHAAAVLQEDEVASARLHVPRGQYRTTLDRSFVCPGPTQEQVLSALSQVEVPATVVFPDTPCARESREELTAEVLGRRVAGAGSPPLRLATLLGVQRISPTDDPDDVAEDVAAWLDAHRERFDDPRGPAGRTPEHLGLLPLPTFRCPEEARRYLGPRRVPDAAAIEAALRQLRADDEAPSTPSSEASGDGARTALCADPPTYYGRVG